MARFRTAFSVALLSAFWLLPVAAHADDVTVDYSQLETRDNDAPLFSDITAEDLSPLKSPIHLHPLTANIASTTVKNLAAEASKPEIHLHPPAPKAVASAAPSAPVQASNSAIPAPTTSIDMALAAVPVAPRPVEDTASAAPAPLAIGEIKTAARLAPAEESEAKPPETKTDIALDEAALPAKPKQDEAPEAFETTLADAPVAPPAPVKTADDNAPPGFVRVNAVASKTDELTAEDVVGLDLGAPPKTESQ
jgi:hypothetical protein